MGRCVGWRRGQRGQQPQTEQGAWWSRWGRLWHSMIIEQKSKRGEGGGEAFQGWKDWVSRVCAMARGQVQLRDSGKSREVERERVWRALVFRSECNGSSCRRLSGGGTHVPRFGHDDVS